MSKRNIGKEIIEGFAALKAEREGKITLRRYVVDSKPASKKATSTVSKVMPPSVPSEPWILERLKNLSMAAAYVEVAIEEGDPGALAIALRRVVNVQGGVSKMVRRSRLSRETINNMISTGRNVELVSFKALLAAAGLRLSIKPVESRARKAA